MHTFLPFVKQILWWFLNVSLKNNLLLEVIEGMSGHSFDLLSTHNNVFFMGLQEHFQWMSEVWLLTSDSLSARASIRAEQLWYTEDSKLSVLPYRFYSEWPKIAVYCCSNCCCPTRNKIIFVPLTDNITDVHSCVPLAHRVQGYFLHSTWRKLRGLQRLFTADTLLTWIA